VASECTSLYPRLVVSSEQDVNYREGGRDKCEYPTVPIIAREGDRDKFEYPAVQIIGREGGREKFEYPTVSFSDGGGDLSMVSAAIYYCILLTK